MVAHSLLHKSSKTSPKHGAYNTQSHLQQMQSNGQAEHFVETIKNSLTKAIEGGEDPHLAMLTYISTPLNHSLPSHAELLNSRRYRHILPVQIKQHDHTHQYRNIMQRQKHYQTKILQQKCKRLTQSQDWETSLHATITKNKKLDTRIHHRETELKNI